MMAGTSDQKPAFSVRPLLPSDLEALVAITSQVAYGAAWSQIKLETELIEAKSLGSFVDFELGSKGSLAAFVFYRDIGEVLEISWLATEARWQRRGLMSDLLRSLADASRSAKEIWLEVHESNDEARNLYEKIGFKVTSRRPRYYADGGAALLMSWGLS